MQTDGPNPRWVLAIETSNPSAHDDPPAAGVAAGLLGPRGRIEQIIEERLDPGSRHDDGLMPAIESLRGRLGVHPGGLARVCVSIGPGGYTALRIAATTANLLAETTGAERVAVPSAAVVAAGVREPPPFAVCLASKRGTTHATVFEDGAPGRVVGLIGPDEVEGLGVGLIVADGFLPGPIRERAGALGVRIASPVFSPSACLRVGLGLEPSPVLWPVYAREAEAVRLWRAGKQG